MLPIASVKFARFLTQITTDIQLILKAAEMSAWRQAGLNYINYSTIAARILRSALKADLKADAERRGTSMIRMTPWADGKAIKDAPK